MRTLKVALALVALLLFFSYSLVMLRRVLGVATPWLALLAMFYFLALSKVAEPLFVLRLPASLRPLRPWERRAHAYRRLAVPAFGSLLRRTPLRFLNTAVYLDTQAPQRVCRLVEAAEAAHFWATALLLPFTVFSWLDGKRLAAVGLLFSLVVVNVYPVLHLRLARARLDRVMRRRPSTHTAPPRSGGA